VCTLFVPPCLPPPTSRQNLLKRKHNK
jgi:hypothetical protein